MKISDVTQKSIITNGKPHESTIKAYTDKGFVHLSTHLAKIFHPYAMDSDYIAFFAKPIDKEEYDAYMKSFRTESEMSQAVEPVNAL